ncbi:MAG: hypothetical protein OEZ39_15190 [Gammaproteobacteria bacterium]|nr:hypothetical protein [Gammaproteobacteria bacterium]MDH5653199.1 hypothetical protein [Gammaproteobacteria bacterium]
MVSLKTTEMSGLFMTGLCLLLALTVCTRLQAGERAGIAVMFVKAVNQNDIETVAKLTADQLAVRTHEWRPVPNEYAFEYGKTSDFRLHNKQEIRDFFKSHIQQLKVESAGPIRYSLDQLHTELGDLAAIWQDLHIFLFQRGMGDVEHIFVVGVDRDNRIRGIYYN